MSRHAVKPEPRFDDALAFVMCIAFRDASMASVFGTMHCVMSDSTRALLDHEHA